jgi:hypothetical protein
MFNLVMNNRRIWAYAEDGAKHADEGVCNKRVAFFRGLQRLEEVLKAKW